MMAQSHCSIEQTVIPAVEVESGAEQAGIDDAVDSETDTDMSYKDC